MRNQFRSSFRATARSHGQLRSLSKPLQLYVCVCVRECAWVTVWGDCVKPKKPSASQRPIVIYSLASVCECVWVCMCESVILNFGGSVLPLFPHMPFGLGWGPPPAGTAVQVHCHWVLRPDQGGVPVPSSPVSQVRVWRKSQWHENILSSAVQVIFLIIWSNFLQWDETNIEVISACLTASSLLINWSVEWQKIDQEQC